MTTITFENFKDVPVVLAVEPWAQAEAIPANGKATLVFDGEPDRMSFSVDSDGSATIGLMNEVTFSVGDKVIWDGRKERPA